MSRNLIPVVRIGANSTGLRYLRRIGRSIEGHYSEQEGKPSLHLKVKRNKAETSPRGGCRNNRTMTDLRLNEHNAFDGHQERPSTTLRHDSEELTWQRSFILHWEGNGDYAH
jgi:hypothetical protein